MPCVEYYQQYWFGLQERLFPALEEALGPLAEHSQRAVGCHSGAAVADERRAMNRARVTFVIFDNRHRTAETEEGRQPNPVSGPPIRTPRRVSLAALARACGVDHLHEPDPFDTRRGPRCDPARGGFEDGVSVVLLSAGCPAPCCTDPRR